MAAPYPVNHIGEDLEFSTDFVVRDDTLSALAQRLNESPLDTRRALAPYTPEADQYQQKVIEARDHTLRVLAPAGSGKTQTVINRVLHRVATGLHPARALVLTFDNAAAGALRTKLASQVAALPGADLSGLTISTLNAFGFGLLGMLFPAERKPIAESWRLKRIVRDCLDGLRVKSPRHAASLPRSIARRYYLEFFGLLKNELFDPRCPNPQAIADFITQRPQGQVFLEGSKTSSQMTVVVQAVLWLFRAYEQKLYNAGLMDFDDQKLRAYSCLTLSPDVAGVVQGRYDEVIVDEFQDINRLDFALITLVAKDADLVVTGDDDQAIYGFRGCTPDFIIDLEQHASRRVASHELRINYRCPANLVRHADQLIRHNHRRVPKDPIPHNGQTSEIKVVSTVSAGIEARSVVTLFRRMKRAQPQLGYQDLAVLYRTNAQSLPLQVEFILADIPYFVREEDNILRNDLLRRLLSVLRLQQAIQRGSHPSALDAANTIAAYFRYVGPSALRQLESLFGKYDFQSALDSPAFIGILPKAQSSRLRDGVRALLEAGTLLDTLHVLADRFRGLAGMLASLEDVASDRAPLGEVFELAANFQGNTGHFIEAMETALQRAAAANAGNNRDGGVALLTYFRSKGLQWHTVVLTGCNDGLIPHKRAHIDDERRLFYVAMTRATSNLLISYVRKVAGHPVQASRFLKEAGLLSR